MESKEIRKKDKKELNSTVFDLRKKLDNLKFKSSLNKVKNTKEVSNIKKDIARLLTIIKEKK